MKSRITIFVLGAAALVAPALAQQSDSSMSWFLSPQVQKELAARASDVTEVTLDKNMLGFAAKFMDKNDKDQEATKQLIEGLSGIYVRDYEFDKDGQYSMDDVDRLRQAFQTPEWSPMVHEHETKGGESTDVMIKLVNGEPQGIFVLDAEPRELTVVLILGPIRMDQLSELKGLSGLGALGDIGKDKPGKDGPGKDKSGKDGAGEKANKGGDQ
jgi:Domain of unknown function (DUF4252)